WRGHGALPGDDGWVSLHLAETAHLTLAPPSPEAELSELHHQVLEALDGGGAFFFRTLSNAVAVSDDEAMARILWDLTWSGHISNDTLAPLRALLLGGRTAHKPRRTAPRSARYSGRSGSLGALSGRQLTTGRISGSSHVSASHVGPVTAGRWSRLPTLEPDATVRSYATAELLLDRYGILTRGSVATEGIPGGFASVYRVLAAAEESGRVRRGYFVEGLGAAQFATTGAVDRLRAQSRPLPHEPAGSGTERTDRPPSAVVLAASDPANPYGAALSWPARVTVLNDDPEGATPVGTGASPGHKPGRKAGALVVLVDGALTLYVERGGKTLLSWTEAPGLLQSAADALALAVREGALGRLTVEKADGTSVLASDHPLAAALAGAGFHATPRGLRLRR
ncbi:MAG: ATP-dependent helicase Lhr and Lhr-like helicase, partial [Actinomycetota bacterium]|nr:ATP-dependent helicase Lhr and Lhr-like helicase [Actinomycetota bacterium]